VTLAPHGQAICPLIRHVPFAGAAMGEGGQGVAGTSVGVGGTEPALGGMAGTGDGGVGNLAMGGVVTGGIDAGGSGGAPAGGTQYCSSNKSTAVPTTS
jgi:hypothetical protein